MQNIREKYKSKRDDSGLYKRTFKFSQPKYDDGKDKYNFYPSAFDQYGNLKPELTVTTPQIEVVGRRNNGLQQYYDLQRRVELDNMLKRHSEIQPSTGEVTVGNGALERVYPEFDFLLFGGPLIVKQGLLTGTDYVSKNIGNYVRGHIFENITPVGYGDGLNRGLDALKGILSFKRPNIESPKWFTDYMEGESGVRFGKKFRGVDDEELMKARFDAWRLYNGFPQKYNTFKHIPNVSPELSEGLEVYTANLAALKNSNRALQKLWQYDDDFGVGTDIVNGSGGNVGFTTKYAGDNALTRTLDVWDLHPFRENNIFTDLVRKTIYDTKPYYYDVLHNKSRVTDYIDKYARKLDEKIRNLEVGTLYGGRPFKVINDIPYRRVKFQQPVVSPETQSVGKIKLRKKFIDFSDDSDRYIYGFDNSISTYNPLYDELNRSKFNWILE